MAYPTIAATPVASDTLRSAIVAWTIDALIAASQKETCWTGGGLRIVPVAGPGLGLSPTWQTDVIASTGTYDALDNARRSARPVSGR